VEQELSVAHSRVAELEREAVARERQVAELQEQLRARQGDETIIALLKGTIVSQQKEVAELQAVITAVGVVVRGPLPNESALGAILKLAKSAPSDVLDAALADAKADGWDEGWTASESYDGHYAVPVNPYRKGQ
jgi:hypothetical protein